MFLLHLVQRRNCTLHTLEAFLILEYSAFSPSNSFLCHQRYNIFTSVCMLGLLSMSGTTASHVFKSSHLNTVERQNKVFYAPIHQSNYICLCSPITLAYSE